LITRSNLLGWPPAQHGITERQRNSRQQQQQPDKKEGPF